MKWQTTYPTLNVVKTAAFQTLCTWDKELPLPQTDVERTIRKRIKNTLFKKVAKEVKEKEPDIAETWNELVDKLRKFGIGDFDKM